MVRGEGGLIYWDAFGKVVPPPPLDGAHLIDTGEYGILDGFDASALDPVRAKGSNDGVGAEGLDVTRVIMLEFPAAD